LRAGSKATGRVSGPGRIGGPAAKSSIRVGPIKDMIREQIPGYAAQRRPRARPGIAKYTARRLPNALHRVMAAKTSESAPKGADQVAPK